MQIPGQLSAQINSVSAIRGTNELFQFQSIDPILRIAPSTWGLNDRDIPIKRDSQQKLLDTLVAILSKRGTGIHQSEIAASSSLAAMELNATTLFSLAVTDNRLRFNSGRFLYLEEWGGPRRETVAEAVKTVLVEADGPISFDEITSKVAERVKREFPPTVVSGCLQALEAEYDAATARWSFNHNNLIEEPDLFSAEQRA
ncbi:hypothetical protein [Aminobacter aminovorans]|uniref:hypothetical protein n=1 Tax=Aminobacter aminovorans TaxID=83263 RepID=UPI00285736B1|nr:hypothetical protein [Aminobacter aminovorans]MDR7225384.1 hypothetical protein [Aminobacter aminovorans]